MPISSEVTSLMTYEFGTRPSGEPNTQGVFRSSPFEFPITVTLTPTGPVSLTQIASTPVQVAAPVSSGQQIIRQG